jgi:hypothetical protein
MLSDLEPLSTPKVSQKNEIFFSHLGGVWQTHWIGVDTVQFGANIVHFCLFLKKKKSTNKQRPTTL